MAERILDYLNKYITESDCCSDSIQGTQSAMAAGLGVSVVPKSAVSKDLNIMSKGFPELPATSIQAYSNSVDPHPLIEPFIDFIKEELAGI